MFFVTTPTRKDVVHDSHCFFFFDKRTARDDAAVAGDKGRRRRQTSMCDEREHATLLAERLLHDRAQLRFDVVGDDVAVARRRCRL